MRALRCPAPGRPPGPGRCPGPRRWPAPPCPPRSAGAVVQQGVTRSGRRASKPAMARCPGAGRRLLAPARACSKARPCPRSSGGITWAAVLHQGDRHARHRARFSAISRPMKPPPITTARLGGAGLRLRYGSAQGVLHRAQGEYLAVRPMPGSCGTHGPGRQGRAPACRSVSS